MARYLATPEPPPLANMPSLSEPGSKARLLRHLDQCIAEIDIEICPHSTGTAAASTVTAATAATTTTFVDSPSSSCYDMNNVGKKRYF